MLSGVPNFAYATGHTNMSWTLKVDLVCEHFCRLVAHADAHGADAVVPELPASVMEPRPLLDLKAGYVLRSIDALPKQGAQAPWQLAMNYRKDTHHLRDEPVADPALRLFNSTPADITLGMAA